MTSGITYLKMAWISERLKTHSEMCSEWVYLILNVVFQRCDCVSFCDCLRWLLDFEG